VYYPAGLYSLSHVALPFPMTDSLYGLTPDPNESFGINLGALAPRGERNVLIASLDSLLRASSNPFFPYMIERIDQDIGSGKRVESQGAAATLPQASGDNGNQTPGWTFNDLLSLIFGSAQQDDSDPSSEP
jgi:hypothetical protein